MRVTSHWSECIVMHALVTCRVVTGATASLSMLRMNLDVGCGFRDYSRATNREKNRADRRLAENQPGKRPVAVVIRGIRASKPSQPPLLVGREGGGAFAGVQASREGPRAAAAENRYSRAS